MRTTTRRTIKTGGDELDEAARNSVKALLKDVRPLRRRWLWRWIREFTGITLPHRPVCLDEGHCSPFDMFAEVFLERPDLILWHGPRGSGKSFMSALDTHMNSRFYDRHGTRILGGSKAQSAQIYEALDEIVFTRRARSMNDSDTLASLLAQKATYRNGSTVSILAASKTSVRGPHVPSLKLDEVDEIKPEIRESAVGMAMEKDGGPPTSILMSSTWHNVGGPMEALMDRGRAGEFPIRTFCIFDVLERCPDERSGKYLEKCPLCPLMEHCHKGKERHKTARWPMGEPKAKRSSGHYTIASLIQKTRGVSPRVFASDFLCLGPKASGIWFTQFDESIHSNDAWAEYDPAYPVHVSLDSGVITGGVFCQVKQHPKRPGPLLTVFADQCTDNIGAEANGVEAIRIAEKLCGGRREKVSTDPVGSSKNPVGITVLSLYQQSGLCRADDILRWSHKPGTVKAGLDLLDSLMMAADKTVRLAIHSRCVNLLKALRNYRRAQIHGVYLDTPHDPQHPFEDMVDALRGAAFLEFPNGIVIPEPQAGWTVPATSFFK